MLESPVLDLQRQSGATVEEGYGWHLPSAYSSLEEEYHALTRAVGLLDRSHIGRLKLSGDDAIDLLDRLSTNKLDGLNPGHGMGTVLTNAKGRIVDLLFVLQSDDHLLALTSPQNRQKVAEWIDFYTFVEDVSVQDVTEDTAMLALAGPNAAKMLEDVFSIEASALSLYDHLTTALNDVRVLVVRTDFAGQPGYDLIVDASEASSLWQLLLERGTQHDIKPVGTDALETLRIERGVPVYGKELSEDVNPLEANLIHFVSFNKGCYIGQEVVARLDTYDKVQRHLVGLSWDAATVDANAAIQKDGKSVGRVTSSVKSPGVDNTIALGYVRKAQAAQGTTLVVESNDCDIEAQVQELPFTR